MFQTLCTLSFPPLQPTHTPPGICTGFSVGARNPLSLLTALAAALQDLPSVTCHVPSALSWMGIEMLNTQDWTPRCCAGPAPKGWSLNAVLHPRCALPGSCKPRRNDRLKCSASPAPRMNPMNSIPESLASQTISKSQCLKNKIKNPGTDRWID